MVGIKRENILIRFDIIKIRSNIILIKSNIILMKLDFILARSNIILTHITDDETFGRIANIPNRKEFLSTFFVSR